MKIRKLAKSDLESASLCLAQSFRDDPMIDYYFPQIEKREKKIHDYMKFSCSLALKFGSSLVVEIDQKVVATALVFPPEQPIVSTLSVLSQLIFFPKLLNFHVLYRYYRLTSVFDGIQPNNPHFYLFLIGVFPEYQSQGIGAGILDNLTNSAKSLNVPVYLETFNSKNLRLYERSGFKIFKELEISHPSQLRAWSLIWN